MKKIIIAALAATAATACGASTEDACNEYLSAWDACYVEYYDANDLGDYTSTLTGTCDGIANNATSTALYQCYTDAVDAADCTDLSTSIDLTGC